MEEVIIIHKDYSSVGERFYKHINATGLANVKPKFMHIFDKLENAKEVIKKHTPNILFLGIWFNGKEDGLRFCRIMKLLYPKMKIVIITSPEDYDDYQDVINEKGSANGYITENANKEIVKRAIEELTSKSSSFFQYDEYTPSGEGLEPLTVNPEWYSMVAQIIENQDDNEKKLDDYIKLIRTLENNIIDAAKNPEIYKLYNKELHNIIFRRSYNDWKIARIFGINKDDVTQARSKFAYIVQRNQSVVALTVEKQDAALKNLTETEKKWLILIAADVPSKRIAKMTPKSSKNKTTPTESMNIETFNKKRNALLESFKTNSVGLVFKALENKINSWDDVKTARKNYLIFLLNEFLQELIKKGIISLADFKINNENNFFISKFNEFKKELKSAFGLYEFELLLKALKNETISCDEKITNK